MSTKTKSGRVVRMPTPAEDARINAGIAADADARELTDEFFASAKPAADALDAETLAKLASIKKRRGRPLGSVAEKTKVAVSMRFDPELLEAMRASGTGWQTRVNDILRREFVRRR